MAITSAATTVSRRTYEKRVRLRIPPAGSSAPNERHFAISVSVASKGHASARVASLEYVPLVRVRRVNLS